MSLDTMKAEEGEYYGSHTPSVLEAADEPERRINSGLALR